MTIYGRKWIPFWSMNRKSHPYSFAFHKILNHYILSSLKFLSNHVMFKNWGFDNTKELLLILYHFSTTYIDKQQLNKITRIQWCQHLKSQFYYIALLIFSALTVRANWGMVNLGVIIKQKPWERSCSICLLFPLPSGSNTKRL